MGGLGISDPCADSSDEFVASVQLTSPLCASILHPISEEHESLTKRQLHAHKCQRLQEIANSLFPDLPHNLQLAVTLACEKGSSTWLTALPLESHSFSLQKSGFRDALCLRYDWHIPTHCACGEAFDVKHALSCPFGGFPTIRHNEVRDLLASLLCEKCPNVRTEPQLDSLTGEIFPLATTFTADEAQIDIQAGGFWGNSRFETALFDVNPFMESNRSSSSTSSTYRKHEG